MEEGGGHPADADDEDEQSWVVIKQFWKLLQLQNTMQKQALRFTHEWVCKNPVKIWQAESKKKPNVDFVPKTF